MNFWWRYPLWKGRLFLTAIEPRPVREMAHVLRIGPIALAIVWQEPVEEPRDAR